MQFVGRFHPLSVHLPIALLVLAPLIELKGRTCYFPYLLPAVDFPLGVAVCGAVAAAFLGWNLARSGAYSGQKFSSLDQLESLSIFDTLATPAALPTLARLPKLRRVYASGTRISAKGPMPQEIRDKVVF